MNKIQGKIKSFTITELLVVMAISTIVVSLAFSVIGLLRRNAQNIQTNYKAKTDLRLLEQQLALDLQNFPDTRVAVLEDKLVFASPIDSISYQFEQEYILRELDTFFLAPKEKTFYALGETISKGSVDAIKLNFSEKEKEHSIFLYKRNDALRKSKYGI